MVKLFQIKNCFIQNQRNQHNHWNPCLCWQASVVQTDVWSGDGRSCDKVMADKLKTWRVDIIIEIKGNVKIKTPKAVTLW